MKQRMNFGKINLRKYRIWGIFMRSLIFTFSSYEKVLVFCEKSLSEFTSNLYVLRPPESGKAVSEIENSIF